MNITKWLSALPQFLILLPTAASCYLLTEKQMKYTPARTAALCLAVLIPYALTASWVHAALKVSINLILLLSLVPFFFLFRATVKTDLPLSLAIYVGVCAIETFPIQFAYLFDACRHPLSGAANLSAEAAFFASAFPACCWQPLSAPPAGTFHRRLTTLTSRRYGIPQ